MLTLHILAKFIKYWNPRNNENVDTSQHERRCNHDATIKKCNSHFNFLTMYAIPFNYSKVKIIYNIRLCA